MNKYIALFCLLMINVLCFSQSKVRVPKIEEILDWEISVVVQKNFQTNKLDTIPQLRCTILIEDYHIFSTDPGDQSLIPTNFKLVSENGDTTALVDVQERGKLITQDIEGLGVAKYYQDRITYTIPGLRWDTRGKLLIQYQLCTDKFCLPPNVEVMNL